MKKIDFIEKGTKSHWMEYKGMAFVSWDFDAKFDFENGVYYPICDEEYAKVDFPTLNDLKKAGELSEVSDDYVITPSHKTMTEERVAEIIEEFRLNGYNVTEEAIVHNWRCWNSDLKSGFRGEDFFLFSPCGCNPLRFVACHLHEADASWQKTYEA